MRKLPKVRKINWRALALNLIGIVLALIPPAGNLLFNLGVWESQMDPTLFALIFGYGAVIIPIVMVPVFLSGIWEDFIPSVKWHIVSRQRRAEAKEERDRMNAEYSAFLDAFDASTL